MNHLVDGYTHYWASGPGDPDILSWGKAQQDVRKLLSVPDLASLVQVDKRGGTATCFKPCDDIGPEEYTQFLLTRAHQSFVFCRTFRHKYDLAVTVALVVFKFRLGPWLTITSDGSWGDWEPAREVCRKVLGYKTEDFETLRMNFCELLDKDDPDFVPMYDLIKMRAEKRQSERITNQKV